VNNNYVLNHDGFSITKVGISTYLVPKLPLIQESGLEALREVMTLCLEKREVQLVIDLATEQTINSKFMETLLSAQDELIRAGGWLKVTHASPNIVEVFRFTGFSNYVGIISREGGEATEVQVAQSGPVDVKLGDRLIQKGLISDAQIKKAIAIQKSSGQRLGVILIEKAWVAESEVLKALAEQLDIPFIKLRAGLYDEEVVRSLDRVIARRLKVMPLFKVRGVLTLATADPQALPCLNEIADRMNCTVQPIMVEQKYIDASINETYADYAFSEELIAEVDSDFEVIENLLPDDYDAIDDLAAGSPVINLVNSIIQRAVRDGASDVHIEPGRKISRIRCRVDGILYETMTPRIELHPAIVSRLKVMANLDIAERRLPQDGRIQVHTQGRSVDLRFSSLPGLFGEKVVLRVLDKSQAILQLDKLGMTDNNLTRYQGLLERSYGLVLVTGPTGSGKTTSLYAGINHLSSIEKNTVTIEDPVEYQLDIVNQNEVKEAIGLTFSKMLKHVLRQDPDIVMVGEIREHETAEIAVQAALTGHLVLSTLHTNDSVGAITRMIDMGLEPYLLSSSLIGVVAQRLVRTICSTCKTSFIAPPEVVAQYGWDDSEVVRLSRGRGCTDCYDSGYKGRIGIHEILEVGRELQQLIMLNPSRDQLLDYIERHRIMTLRDHGLEMVRRGLTTIEEVSRVVNAY